MTALKKYERLESLGLWRETGDAQRREVIVSFGAASLVLSDANGKPLTHWSLAAVRAVQKGEGPTIYSPDRSSDETLELDDPAMIDAIQEVLASIKHSGPHPGRLRWAVGAAMVLATVAIAVFWLPSISAQYAMRIVPEAQAEQIGRDVLKQTNRLTGRPCDDPQGIASLVKMENWLLPEGGSIHIVDMGAKFSTHLPGGNILLNRVLVEENAGPEVAAGFVLMEKALAEEQDPMADMFRTIGTRATLTFIANGALQEQGLAVYARKRLTAGLTRPDDAALLALFEKAKLTSSPFAYALDDAGKSTASLIQNDPIKENYLPSISDGDWIALQSICGDG